MSNNDYNLANELGAGLHIGQDIRDTAFIKDLDQIKVIGLSYKMIIFNNQEKIMLYFHIFLLGQF